LKSLKSRERLVVFELSQKPVDIFPGYDNLYTKINIFDSSSLNFNEE
jgi:hypothetical protein